MAGLVLLVPMFVMLGIFCLCSYYMNKGREVKYRWVSVFCSGAFFMAAAIVLAGLVKELMDSGVFN